MCILKCNIIQLCIGLLNFWNLIMYSRLQSVSNQHCFYAINMELMKIPKYISLQIMHYAERVLRS